MSPTSLLDDVARPKGRSDVPCPVWPVATHQGELTARRLVITFVPTHPAHPATGVVRHAREPHGEEPVLPERRAAPRRAMAARSTSQTRRWAIRFPFH